MGNNILQNMKTTAVVLFALFAAGVAMTLPEPEEFTEEYQAAMTQDFTDPAELRRMAAAATEHAATTSLVDTQVPWGRGPENAIARDEKVGLAKERVVKRVSKNKVRSANRLKAGRTVAKLEGGLDDQGDRHYDVKNSLGVNKLLGGRVYKPKVVGGHLQPPGYVTGDTSTGAQGHYYLGPSRRRIGAGYGRRRRTKAFSKRKAKKSFKRSRVLSKSSGFAKFKKVLKIKVPKKKKKLRKLKCSYKIRYSTGTVSHAQSKMSPMIRLVAEKGVIKGSIQLPDSGKQMVAHIDGDANAGAIKQIQLSATSRDGWYFTSFEVKACHKKSQRVHFGCTHQWLDGKPYDKSEYYAPYLNEVTLHAETKGRCKRPSVAVKVSTGSVKYASSSQKPSVTIVGSKGSFTGKINVASKGWSETTKFTVRKDLGHVKSVKLKASNRDGWYFTSFRVKTNARKWQSFGCTSRWLDGKPYDKHSSYPEPYGNALTLKPVAKSCKAHFPKGWKKTKKGCFCSGNPKNKHSMCGKHGGKKKWCRTRDGCGKSSVHGKWDYC